MPDLSHVIRLAQKAEIPLLPLIEEAADAIFPSGRLPEPAELHTLEELSRSLELGLLYVGAVGDDVVGFSFGSLRGGLIHLHQVSVLPAFGRRGIGRALVEAILQECRLRGLRGVTLNTFRDIPWNAPFYASMGFIPIPKDELHPAQLASIERAAALGMTGRVAMIHKVGSSAKG